MMCGWFAKILTLCTLTTGMTLTSESESCNNTPLIIGIVIGVIVGIFGVLVGTSGLIIACVTVKQR